MVKKILVPIDGSEASITALKYAVKMAEVIGKNAVIVALEVINIDKYQLAADTIDFSIQNRLLEERKKEVSSHITKAKDICEGRGVTVEGVTRDGFPHEEVIKYVEEDKDIMLVVMGSSGKGFIDRHVIGSVTTKIVREISRRLLCPVLITPYRKETGYTRWNFDDIK